MIELEFLGRSSDARSVIFTDPEGERYQVVITDELRGAMRRDLAYYEGTKSTKISNSSLRPRHIQALLREGLSAQEIADKQGLSLDAVTKYEAPIVAEKNWAINQALQVSLNPDSGSPVLEDLVINRLATRGVDHQSLSWSALKRPGENWEVSLTFIQGAVERSATWILSPDGTKVQAVDQEAQWLTETASPLTPVSAFFPPIASDNWEDTQTQNQQEDLLDRANAMRGHRQPILEDISVEENKPEDPGIDDPENQFFSARALSFETEAPLTLDEATDVNYAPLPFPFQVIPSEVSTISTDENSEKTPVLDPITGAPSGIALAPVQETSPKPLPGQDASPLQMGSTDVNNAPAPVDSASDGTASLFEIPKSNSPSEREQNPGSTMAASDKRRSKRRPVPSWDEIVFGTRHE